MQCPEPTQLTRAHVAGDDAAIAAHAAGCAQCGPEWRELELLAGLGRELAWQRPQRDAVTDMRARVVASFGAPIPLRRRTSRYAGVGLALAAAAAIALWVAVGRDDEPATPAYAGAVRPLPRADFELTAPRPDERVRLFDGSIAVDVGAVAGGERFRVIVGDAEVEARGGALEVVVAGDKLVAVRATRGTVEIRPQFGASVTLHAGERWEPPVVELDPMPVPVPVPVPGAEPEPEADSATDTETETETKPVRERVRAPRRPETRDEPAAVEAPTEVITPPSEVTPTPPSTTTTPVKPPITAPTEVAPTPPTTTPKRDRADDADQRRQDRREDQRQERRQDRREDQRERRRDRREDRRER